MTIFDDQSLSEIRGLPKIDLHRHLLGSVRPETVWELCRKYGVEQGRKTLDEFLADVVHWERTLDLAEYIRPWKLFRQVIREPDDIRRIALECALDAQRDGVRYVEFRNSPTGLPIGDGDAPQTRIPADEYFQAIREGFAAASGVVCRLIASIPRHAVGRFERPMVQTYTEKLLDVLARFRQDLFVGVDLTGIERGWPARLFTDLFAAAHDAGFPVTIHAGETEGPEEVWAAIQELGASRVGHATSAPADTGLVQELIRRNVVLEVCPTTSWLIGSVPTRSDHPVIECVPRLPYVICTDNPTLNASTLSQELLRAAQIAGADPLAFVQSQFVLASQAVFAPRALAGAVKAAGLTECTSRGPNGKSPIIISS
ncbi:MAG: adenosine deaminase family protein [Isosphaeraceae bacterium]